MAYDRKPSSYGTSQAGVPQQGTPAPKVEPATEPDALPELPTIDVEALPREAFAGIARRFFAFVLDCIVVMPTALLIAWPMGTLPFLFDRSAEAVGVFSLAPGTAKLISNAVTILLYDIYFVGTVRQYGYTLGMHMADIAVVDREGRKPTKSMARRRYFFAGLVTIPFGLGLLAILWDKHKRGWHDRIVGTWCVHAIVVKRNLQAAGREAKLESPITSSTLLFLPGVLLSFPAIILFGLCMGLLNMLKRK